LPSQGGKLHRMVRIALRPEASFRVASVWAPVAFCRRSPLTATLWAEARAGEKRCLNVSPGCLQGPPLPAHSSPHHVHAPYPFTIPKPCKAQVQGAAPGPKSNLIGPIPGASPDTQGAPMQQPWSSGWGIAWLLTALCYPVGPTPIESNCTVGTGTTTWGILPRPLAIGIFQRYWPKPGDNYAGGKITAASSQGGPRGRSHFPGEAEMNREPRRDCGGEQD
jgi:hypothetical protein